MEYVLEECVHRVHHLVRLVALILVVTIVGHRKASPLLVVLTSYSLATYGRVVQGVLDFETVSKGLALLSFRSVHILPVPARRRVALVSDLALREESFLVLVRVLALDILIFLPAVNPVLTLAPQQKMQVANLVVPRRL